MFFSANTIFTSCERSMVSVSVTSLPTRTLHETIMELEQTFQRNRGWTGGHLVVIVPAQDPVLSKVSCKVHVFWVSGSWWTSKTWTKIDHETTLGESKRFERCGNPFQLWVSYYTTAWWCFFSPTPLVHNMSPFGSLPQVKNKTCLKPPPRKLWTIIPMISPSPHRVVSTSSFNNFSLILLYQPPPFQWFLTTQTTKMIIIATCQLLSYRYILESLAHWIRIHGCLGIFTYI